MTEIRTILYRSVLVTGLLLLLSSVTQVASASRTQQAAKQQLYNQYAKLAKRTKTRMMLTPGNHPVYAPDQIVYHESQLPQTVTPLHASKSYQNALTHFPVVQYSSKYDHSAVVKGSGTPQQRAELRRYALQLINSYRTQHGASRLKPTDDEDRAIEQTADLRSRAHMLFEHIQFQKSYLQIYDKIGMLMTGENLSVNPWAGKAIENHQPVTMMMLKTGIYTSLETMLYADGASHWGHRENFLYADKLNFGLQYCGPRYDVPYVYVFEGYTPKNQYLMYSDKHLQLSMTKPKISTKSSREQPFITHQQLTEPSHQQRVILKQVRKLNQQN